MEPSNSDRRDIAKKGQQTIELRRSEAQRLGADPVPTLGNAAALRRICYFECASELGPSQPPIYAPKMLESLVCDENSIRGKHRAVSLLRCLGEAKFAVLCGWQQSNGTPPYISVL